MSDLQHIRTPGHLYYGSRHEASAFLDGLGTGNLPTQGKWSGTTRRLISAMPSLWRDFVRDTYGASEITSEAERMATYKALLGGYLELVSSSRISLPCVFLFLEAMLAFDPLFERSVISLVREDKAPKPAFVRPICLLVESLGVSSSRESFEFLLELVTSDEHRIARSAAASLGNWSGEEVADRVIPLLGTVTSDQVVSRLRRRLRENGIDTVAEP